ncbi:unnamed protein product [Gongylonema pulchrum]|uniref:GBD/FH3 domain-containing protein n=1 Tax=Gongylonema pulchrum TaxID=637853 RepID=A0A3P6NN33_9BILA|nr:unnamed protein product [Gongylonema pulchrum]
MPFQIGFRIGVFAARCGLRSSGKGRRRFSSSPCYNRRSNCVVAESSMAVRIDGVQQKDKPDALVSRLPPEDELLSAFEMVLNKMDLPPDKMRILRSYDLNKKWELVCDQRKMYAVADPSVYLEKLAAYLDRRASKKKKKLLGDETSTEVLKHIEISLRTNSIDWVRSFLSDENNGLNILVEYLTQLQEDGWAKYVLRFNQLFLQCSQLSFYSIYKQFICAYVISDAFDGAATSSSVVSYPQTQTATSSSENGYLLDERTTSSLFRRTTSVTKKNSRNHGARDEDIHVCVSCLRAIMNNKYGFNMVFSNPQAIYCIARSILHQSLRTKALALELLAAICFVSGGHDLIISAFNRFRAEYKETYRFQLLFSYFAKPPEFSVEFMASCMQFFNVVVHTTENMNYRNYLQYELTLLGLDDYLEVLRKTECEELQTHISAYLDNKIDVPYLLDETDKKIELEAENTRLAEELSKIKERLQVVEADYIARLAQLDRRLKELNAEKEKLLKEHDSTLNTMRRTLNEKDKESREQQAKLESRIQELERMQRNMKAGLIEAKKDPAATAKQRSPTSPPSPPSSGAQQGNEQENSMKSNPTPTPTPSQQSMGLVGKPPAPPAPPPPPPPLASFSSTTQPSSLHPLSPPATDIVTIKKVYNTR